MASTGDSHLITDDVVGRKAFPRMAQQFPYPHEELSDNYSSDNKIPHGGTDIAVT